MIWAAITVGIVCAVVIVLFVAVVWGLMALC